MLSLPLSLKRHMHCKPRPCARRLQTPSKWSAMICELAQRQLQNSKMVSLTASLGSSQRA